MVTKKILALCAGIPLLASAVALGSSHASPGTGGFSWSARGVFVFGRLVLDFQRGKLAYGAIQEDLIDCSDSKYFCMRSKVAELALPRSCGDLEGSGSFKAGDVQTQILWKEGPKGRQTLFLGNSAYPHVIFKYTKWNGVESIIWDPRSKKDFVSLAKDGKASAWIGGLPTDRAEAFMYSSRITFDGFGVCSG